MTDEKNASLISELKERSNDASQEYPYVIDKVSLDGDYVKVIINDEETETVFILSALEYFDLGYRISQRITQEDYEKLRRLHAYSYAYRRCINKIAGHDQSVQEIREFLEKSASVDEDDQNKIVENLIRQGLLDDERLVTTQFEYDQLKLHGRRKIAYDLKKRGIDPVMVDEYADKVDFDGEVERGLQKAESLLKSMTMRSYREVQQRLRSKLADAGYDREAINTIMNELDHQKNEDEEIDSLRHQLERAAVRYGRKYKDSQLRQKLYAYLVSRGFSGEDIKTELSRYLQESDENENQGI
ncbi:MAG: RecX family transcriptional regulator [Erysipelotrichaceae bacterium]|nr:RecX family transcriptional regulator [Erysipelotrichaceae bacterium]